MTQGLVLYGTKSPYYPGLTCYGVVITARCDIEQKKVKHLHYLTAVQLEDWIKTDCLQTILEDNLKDATKKIKNWLAENNLYSGIVEEAENQVRDVVEYYSKNFKADKSLYKALDELELTKKILENKFSEKQKIDLLNTTFLKKRKGKIDLLLKNQLGGYYYLQSSDNSFNANGIVVNLRDIRSMPVDNVLNLLKGKYDCTKNPDLIEDVEINKIFSLSSTLSFAYYDYVIKSPIIEHMMQQFSLTFSRIGLEDLDEAKINGIKEIHLN